MSRPVNCKADYVFQFDLKVPASATGVLGAPALGAITGVVVRLSDTSTGTALNALVGNLAASERSGKPGRFYVLVDAALLTAHVLGSALVGDGGTFWLIPSKTGDFDMEAIAFIATDGTEQ
jgi:hypothetical protein